MANEINQNIARVLKFTVVPLVVILALTGAISGVFAQDQTATPDPDAVVARVGGEAITEADLAFAAEDMAQELGNMPPNDRRTFHAGHRDIPPSTEISGGSLFATGLFLRENSRLNHHREGSGRL
jgi:hypothetical protein